MMSEAAASPGISKKQAAPRNSGQRALFVLWLAFALTMQGFFLANVVQWRNAPDYGWVPLAGFEGKAIGFVTAVGQRAGLQTGDRILSLNGRVFDQTAPELGELLNYEVGGQNSYVLQRDGESVTDSVTHEALGWKRTLYQSGLFWLIGMLFLGLGVLVFLMKPYDPASWAFLLMTIFSGIYISYTAPSARYQPFFLYNVEMMAPVFVPAAMLHLAAVFPQRRALVRRHRWVLAIPYLISLAFAVTLRVHGEKSLYLPPWTTNAANFYLLASILTFVASTLESWLRAGSVAARLQAQVVVAGIVVALLIPSLELTSTLVFEVSFFKNQLLYFIFFLCFFPVSIGYAIVRHDLFEIDVIVRRTYGYLLSTAVVVFMYGATVSTLNALTMGQSEIAASPVFTVAFVLVVIFLMQPLQGRIQRFVNRTFYRQRYDYRKTITQATDEIASVLDPELVGKTLVGTVVREMFLENGILLRTENHGENFEAAIVVGIDWPAGRSREVALAKPILNVLAQEKEPVFRHEIELAPHYQAHRQEMAECFDSLGAEMMFPVTYQDELRAVLSVGRKKSGKMFTREDVDLLHTLVSGSAVALENARLFDDLADSLKQVQLLETVKNSLAKFVPQTVEAMIEESPDGAGVFEKREKDMTVMFADIAGYTLLSSQLPIDEVNKIVEWYFGAFLEAILASGGDVNETAGDGLMVLFQDENPERHARAAVRTALAIQRLTREINAKRVGETPIGMHIGVNSGVASVGATKIQSGAGMRWTYTASGPTTNIAARACSLDQPIAVTHETWRRLSGAFDVEAMGPQAFKNVPKPIHCYRVVDVVEGAAAPVAEPLDGLPGGAPGRREFVISGVLTEKESGKFLAGLEIRAWDKDVIFDDYLGSSLTDPSGRFRILFTDEFFANAFDQRPDIYLRVYDVATEREVYSSRDTVRWNAGTEEHFDVAIPRTDLAGGAS